jgi:hypothetical protein
MAPSGALSRRATFTLGLKFIYPAPDAVEIKPAQEKISPPSSSILQKSFSNQQSPLSCEFSTKPAFPLVTINHHQPLAPI